MAEDIGKDDSQVNACNTFVQKVEVVAINKEITGWDDKRVIGLLKDIVNDKDYIKDSTFTLNIKRTNEQTEKTEIIRFQLRANPTQDQPGNGIVTNMNTEKSPTHKELSEKLTEQYENNTCSFAEDIERVFANNLEIFKVPKVTRDAYMILLFEIGRRLVKNESGTESPRKTGFDKLPIASAITRLVNLMAERECTFEEVFLRHGEFNCFIGEPCEREKAICNINYHHALNDIKHMFSQEQTETQTGLEASVQGLRITKDNKG